MSAGLLEYDWMFSVKERPWHGIGAVVEDAPTSEDAIKMAGLDWKVKQYNVKANGVTLDNYFCNMRMDKNIPLGIVKGRYKVVQNVEAFDFVDGIIGNKDIPCRYETAGSLFNGKRIFLLVKLPNKTLLGDDVENYLFFTNSHDGTSSLMAGISNVRVVCNNTLQMAIKGASRTWSCRHTESITEKKQLAKESLGLAVKYMDSMNDMAEKMYKVKLDEEAFFRRLFAESKLKEKNKEETAERLHIIYTQKEDLQNFKGTGWGMYNAVADLVSNTQPLRLTKNYGENKLVSFFDGSKLLETSQKLLLVA